MHPCKIYNIFAVGAPVLYIGPERSHVTEALAVAAGAFPFLSVRHGEAARLAEELLRWKQSWVRSGARSHGPRDGLLGQAPAAAIGEGGGRRQKLTPVEIIECRVIFQQPFDPIEFKQLAHALTAKSLKKIDPGG